MKGTSNIGDRVGAIRNMDDETAWVFGYGVYDGEEVPPEDEKGERGMIDFVHAANVTNPKLLMDDGTIIWGCECWWGPEKLARETISDRKIVIVKPKYELNL